MPLNISINQIADTISQKLTAGAQEAMGSISGALSGTLSSGMTGATSMLNALSAGAGKLGLSSQSLNAAVSQVTNALDLTSTFKGLPKTQLTVVQAKPEQTRSAQINKPYHLKFPEDLGEHYIQFTFKSFNQNSPIDRVAQVDPLTIYLPMSPNLQENYSIGYHTPSMGATGTVVDEAVQKYFADKSAGLSGGNNSWKENLGSALGQGVAAAGTAGKGIAALASKALMDAAPAIGAAIQKNIGAAVNPNMATLFESVGFRKHQFTFKLYPTSQAESEKLKEIIKAIRNRVIPKKLDDQFLGFPDKVDIKIHPKNPYVDGDDKGIRTCVVENMSINYAPNGVAFFKGKQGNPVGVELSLSFQETEIIFFDLSKDIKPEAPKAAPTTNENRDARNSAARALGQ